MLRAQILHGVRQSTIDCIFVFVFLANQRAQKLPRGRV